MDEATLAKVVEHANQLVWKQPNLKVLRDDLGREYSALAIILQQHIEHTHRIGKLILPDLRAFNNETVAVFSDYSGESSGYYYTYSFLICAWNIVGSFHEGMRVVRDKSGLGPKEIAFKDFRMGELRRSLPEYLRLLDTFVPGLLFTLIVDKKLITLFGANERTARVHLAEELQKNGLGEWKPEVAEKLARIVHVGAFLAGLLAKTGQKIFWMSDNDAICPNEELHRCALDLFHRALSIYTDPHCTFAEIGGGAPFKERDLETLDLLSVTDVVSSSVEHYLSRLKASPEKDFEVKAGSEQILQWLGHDGIALKKMSLIVRPTIDGHIRGTVVEFILKNTHGNVEYIPVYF